MAAGDFTRDSGFPRQQGNMWLLSGTMEVDDQRRAFALTDTNSYLLGVQLVDEDGVGTAGAQLNVDASGSAQNGSTAVIGNHMTTQTYRYQAWLV